MADAPVPPVVTTPATDIASRIDALHAQIFAGTPMANDTALWNMTIAFREAVKKAVTAKS